MGPSGDSRRPSLSVVVIGRNEAANLDRCFESVRGLNYPPDEVEVIYVDSASSDGSPEVARRWGVRLIELGEDELGPARARDAGWRNASAPYIFFLDGDCQIEPDFVRLALGEFRPPQVASVFGSVRERSPSCSFYHRANDMLWKGFHAGPGPLRGGNYLMRREPLEVIGGYNCGLLTMENVELGVRLMRSGYVNLRIEVPMVVHELGRVRFADFLRRSIRTGYGICVFFERAGQSGRQFWRDAEFLLQMSNSLLFTFVALTAVALLLSRPVWLLLWLVAAPVALFLVQLLWARRKSPHLPALVRYALHELARSLAVTAGQAWFLLDRLRGTVRFPVDWRRTPDRGSVG